MRISAALLGVAAAAYAAPAPVSLWTSKALTAQDARRMGTPEGLSATLAGLVGAAAGRAGKPARITVLAEPLEAAAETVQRISGALGTPARTQLSATHKSPTPLLALTTALAPSCDVFMVASEEQGQGAAAGSSGLYQRMAPDAYAAAMAAPAASLQRCAVYIVGSGAQGASALNSVPVVEAALAGAAGSSSDGVLRVTAVVALPQHTAGSEPALAADGGSVQAARALQYGSDGVGAAVGGGILMTPAVAEGLLIGALLIFFALLGLSCVMSIATPDVLHSFHLPAGKEY